MKPPLCADRHLEPDVAFNFWPVALRATNNGGKSRVSSRPPVATNLDQLFVHDLAVLVAGACQTDRLARSVFASLPPDQIGIRELVLGLARAARGCLPTLPAILADEGWVLPSTHDSVIDVLLGPITGEGHRKVRDEPPSIAGARALRAFTHVALHFETELARAAQDAWLFGSDRLSHALTNWATMWTDYLQDLRRREKSYRAQAYAAEFLTPPCWQTA